MQGQACRLARVNGRLDAGQRRDLIGRVRGPGELHPLLDTCVELVGGYVLRGDRTRLRPVAGQGISQGQVLADPGIGVLGARGSLERWDRVVAATCKRQREAIVRRIKLATSIPKQSNSLATLALSDLDQRQLQDHLRLIGVDGERVLVGRLSGSKPAACKISIAEEPAVARIRRRL